MIRVGTGPHGRGVFATRRIKAGRTVEVCPTLEVAAADVSGLLLDYVFESNDREDTSILLLGYGMLYNHSSEPNAEYVQEDDTSVAFVTLRQVEEGEELTIDYGEQWWESRDRTPD